ncbi:MAG: histidine phosphatase family protein [Desulfobulbaceae bacterium]|nr:histidine phosphatase family protein [Desulfobulbaceae bacterium]
MKSVYTLPPEKKTLLICRHAKSSWEEGVLRDVDRPLNKRGQRDAPEMGKRLKKRGILPDLIMTSAAVRAKTTAEIIADRLGYPLAELQINPNQYAATVPSLLTLLQEIEPQFDTVMIVGHNPEFTDLVNLLGGIHMENLPTCGIVALEFPVVSWSELAAGSGTLVFFDFPKK